MELYFSRFFPRLWATLLFIGYTIHVPAQINPDSIEISLLTCSPHDEVYSLYGHTALRVTDKTRGTDIAVNYGVFDFLQPHFILRFIFGLTDYSMGVNTIDDFCAQYSYYNSSVTEQVLNLTPSEKLRIMAALAENAKPENVTYRYNFFHDNCTTRARDMIVEHLDGQVEYKGEDLSDITFRHLTDSCTQGHPWTQLGNNLLLGVMSDRPTHRSERQFLPSNLMSDFSTAHITIADSIRPLVSETRLLLPSGPQVIEEEFPLSPITCAIIILVLTLVIIFSEYHFHYRCWIYEAILLFLTGICGIILTMMIFSHHPTVNVNLQILMLSPISLILLYPIVRKSIKGGVHWWWPVWSILILLFYIGGFFQKYDTSVHILALSLLILCITRHHLSKRLVSFSTQKQ
jgi:hypothetical protein